MDKDKKERLQKLFTNAVFSLIICPIIIVFLWNFLFPNFVIDFWQALALRLLISFFWASN